MIFCSRERIPSWFTVFGLVALPVYMVLKTIDLLTHGYHRLLASISNLAAGLSLLPHKLFSSRSCPGVKGRSAYSKHGDTSLTLSFSSQILIFLSLKEALLLRNMTKSLIVLDGRLRQGEFSTKIALANVEVSVMTSHLML